MSRDSRFDDDDIIAIIVMLCLCTIIISCSEDGRSCSVGADSTAAETRTVYDITILLISNRNRPGRCRSSNGVDID